MSSQAPLVFQPIQPSSSPLSSVQEQQPSLLSSPKRSSRIALETSKNPKRLVYVHSVRKTERDSLQAVEDNVPTAIAQQYFDTNDSKRTIKGPKITRCVDAMFEWVGAEQERAVAAEFREQRLSQLLEQSQEYSRMLEHCLRMTIDEVRVRLPPLADNDLDRHIEVVLASLRGAGTEVGDGANGANTSS
ncbi:MAG: hypothetical protein M1835_007307 [Candelina submexicana]|nr:MAG: hypothetical protein M1835_007307 [Candelina submexicana]